MHLLKKRFLLILRHGFKSFHGRFILSQCHAKAKGQGGSFLILT